MRSRLAESEASWFSAEKAEFNEASDLTDLDHEFMMQAQ